jgi:hypothetical protein
MDETPPQRTDQPTVLSYARPSLEVPCSPTARIARTLGRAGLACLTVAVLGIFLMWPSVLALLPVGALAAAMAAVLGLVALIRRDPGGRVAAAGVAYAVAAIFPLALLLAIVNPPLARARVLARQSICASNLKSIGTAIAMYRVGNAQAAPPNLTILVNQGLVSARILISPSSPGKRQCDYFYLPPAVRTASNMTMVACSFKDVHAEGRTVLYFDTHVMYMRTADFAAELALPHNAEFAKALAQAEGP